MSTDTPGTPDPGTGPLVLALGAVSHPAGSYSATFQLTSSVAASCRMASQPNTPYAAMYDNITASANGLTHTKTASFGTTGPQTVHVACKATSSGEEKALTVAIP